MQADPRFLEAWLNLGYLEEVQGQIEPALVDYGQALTLSPASTYAQEHFRALFYAKRFPRRIPLAHLALVPVPLTADVARGDNCLPPTSTPREERIAYTTDLIFPDQMRANAGLLSVPLPVTGAAEQSAAFNRVCYGFTAAPDATALTMRVAVYYPSATLTEAGTDYSALAVRLTHWLTRVLAYYELHLGLALPAEPVAVYLCEGPTGETEVRGECSGNALYFYKLAAERSPLEWMRQAAHETGHLLLPKMGRFTVREPWASGDAGERLALQWLAQEAGLVAGEPWPSRAAQDKLKGLWSGAALPLAGDYLAPRCRTLLDAWALAGPAAPQLNQDTEAALSYLCGFLLWVQAAHDDSVLADTLKHATGTNPSHFLEAYQNAVTARLTTRRPGYLPVWGGALTVAASKLTTPPVEGALRRSQVTLAAGDTANYRLYLPEGAWQVTIMAPPAAGLKVKVDDQPVATQADKHEVFSLTTEKAGWHGVTLEGTGKEPAVVEYLRVEAGKEA